MVDPIGVKTVTAAEVAPPPRVANTTPTPAVAPATTGASDTAHSQASALSKTMASSAPVDTDRIAEIRRAIANGTFPILPATIADRLMALRLEWNSDGAGNDEA